jgi:hypothetical protein
MAYPAWATTEPALVPVAINCACERTTRSVFLKASETTTAMMTTR